MGYRSEVAIKCEEKAFEMFRETYKRVELVPDKVYKDGEYFILYWDWIKWYESYDDIMEIEGVMDALDAIGVQNEINNTKETGYGYRFMRLGEDDIDIETRENDWSIELLMIRKIDIPEDAEEIEK